MEKEVIEGFELPIYRALTEKVLWAGAPRGMVILNGLLAVFICVILKNYYIVILNIVMHTICVMFAKKDPLFFEIFLRSALRSFKHKGNSFYSV